MNALKFILLSILLGSIHSQYYQLDQCQLCETVIEASLLKGELAGQYLAMQYNVSHFFPKFDFFNDGNKSAHHFCQQLSLCPQIEKWQLHYTASNDTNFNLRVTKALGSKGYDKVRISVVTNASTNEFENFGFTYQRQFQHRWTNMYLYSKIVDVVPGESNKFQIGTHEVNIKIPRENEGTRGIIFADPCYSSKYVSCLYKDQFETFKSLTQLLNAALKHDDVDFWGMLGDNFYDRYGDLTQQFFDALTVEAKQKLMISVVGNHDYWVLGTPYLKSIYDQYGNGFMQFYAQDSIAASHNESEIFNFTVDPDNEWFFQNRKADVSNFAWYNKIGDFGFIAYSAAYSYDENLPYLQQACDFFKDTSAKAVFLLGHWNDESSGCTDAKMPVPNLYNELLKLPGCDTLGNKLKYIEGHAHCNVIKQNNTGFMVGGNGMSDSSCGGYFGMPVFDSTKDNKLRILYYPISDVTGLRNFDKLYECFDQNGLSGCEHLAIVWSEISLDELNFEQPKQIEKKFITQ